jgi:hypothetical protein
MTRYLNRSKKNSFRNKKRNSRKQSRKVLRGGSPASNRVMGFLPKSCNPPQEFNLPPVDANISNMRLYATTGGARKLKGGAIRMPSEYFGINSGRYQVDANAGRSPESYGYMKGGKRSKRSKRSKKSRKSRRGLRGGSPASNRVMSFLPAKQNGGAIRMPSEYFGVNSGRYQVDANAGRSPESYGYMKGGCGGSSCGCGCNSCRSCTCGQNYRGGFVRDGSIQNFRGLTRK